MRWHAGGGGVLWLVLALLVGGGIVLSAPAWRGGGDPEKIWAQAEADLRAERIAAAESAVSRLARLREPTPEDRMLRAQVAVARRRIDEALAELAKIPDTAPISPQARLLAGQVELRRDRLASAERHLREAVRLDPKLVQAHRELIFIYGMLLRRKALDREFRALSESTTLTFDNMFHWTLTRSTEWEPRELRADLERFLKADPNDRATRLALAECLRRLGLRDEADATLAPVPKSDAQATAIRVRLALDRGDDAAAEALLKEGPDDDPELAQLRGKLLLARGDAEAALREFRRAYAAEPDNRDTVAGLAAALKRLRRDDEAAPFLRSARNYDLLNSLMTRAAVHGARNDLKLIAALGAVNEALGRLYEARGWYQLVIAAEPLNAEAQHALFRVKAKLAQSPPPVSDN